MQHNWECDKHGYTADPGNCAQDAPEAKFNVRVRMKNNYNIKKTHKLQTRSWNIDDTKVFISIE
jgi:hypothetical protein